jgi:hypothetical protein
MSPFQGGVDGALEDVERLVAEEALLADLEDRLRGDAATTLLGFGRFDGGQSGALVHALREGGLIEAGEARGEVFHQLDQRAAALAPDGRLLLEQDLVHLPELPLQSGACRRLGGTLAPITIAERVAEDEAHLAGTHILLDDLGFNR